MGERCAHCGSELHGEPEAVWIDPSTGSAPQQPQPARRRFDRRLLLILGGLIGAWLLFVGVARLASPDEVAQPPTPTPEPAAIDVPTPTPAPTLDEVTTAVDDPTSELDVAQLGARVETTVQIERMVRQLGRRGTAATVAYRAAEGIVLVDLGLGTTQVIEPSTESVASSLSNVVVLDGMDSGFTLDLTRRDVLLRGAGQTFAIDAATNETRTIADDGALIVSRTTSDTMYWAPGGTLRGLTPEIFALIDGSPYALTVPTSTSLLAIDGVGVLAVGKGPARQTWVTNGQAFEPFSDDRVFDANALGVLEEVCDAQGCDFRVRSQDPDADWTSWDVPPGFIDTGDRFALSPDARSLARHTPTGFAEVYDANDENFAWVTGGSMQDVAWGPNSSFVAWIDLLSQPEIQLMFLDERDWLSLNLLELGLPRPVGTEIVVFASQT